MGKWGLDYFKFTRRDRVGVLFLVFLILIVFILPRFFGGPRSAVTIPDTAWVAKLKELELKQEITRKVRRKDTADEPVYVLQYERVVYKPIQERRQYADTNAFSNYKPYKKAFHYPVIDINTADTTAFISLPGIGSKLASRIINFREKLGGFYSIEQIAEIYGLADSVFQKLKQYLQLNNTEVRKININTVTIDELKAHPYIKYNIANAIIAYRNEHGPFLKIEDVKKVMIVTEEWYNKTSAYLSAE